MKGIIFSGPMVRAIWERRKTVTRRPVKLPDGFIPDCAFSAEMETPPVWFDFFSGDYVMSKRVKSPYRPGEIVYVKETFTATKQKDVILYRADPFFETMPKGDLGRDWNWTPSIQMPAWAARLKLEIVSVRPERLQEITEEDVVKEGIARLSTDLGIIYVSDGIPSHWTKDPIDSYRDLWNSIYGTGSWDKNEWVWRIEFREHWRAA